MDDTQGPSTSSSDGGTDMGLDDHAIHRAEETLRGVQGIESVAIDHARGEILAVHVLASGDRKPKQVVRDVVSALRTRLSVTLDHKKVSVVLLGAKAESPAASPAPAPAANGERSVAPEPAPAPAPEPAVDPTPVPAADATGRASSDGPSRVAVHAISVRDMREESEAEVVLRHGQREAMGIARGNGAGVSGGRLVASATANALERFLDSRHRIEIGEVKQVELGNRSAILVTVTVNAGRDEYVLLGSCWVFDDLRRATVYATLDATNRVIGRLERRQHVDYEVVPENQS